MMIEDDDQSLMVELYFSGRNLKDLDIFSKSDPFLTVNMQRSINGNIQNVGRTQTVTNNINPNWKQKITVQYYFEKKQPIYIQVYDEDSTSNADFIGKTEITLGKIMGSDFQTLTLDLKTHHDKPAGQVVIRAEKVEKSSQSLFMKWRGKKIANVDSFFDFLDKSDPYLKFLKIRGDNTDIQIGRTQTLMDNQDPAWNPIQLPTSKLYDINNPQATFKIECWDFQQGNKAHKFIGELFINPMNLINTKLPYEYLMSSGKLKKPGALVLQNYRFIQTPNFIDYLKSGLQLNLVVAIDFTGSNGVPSSPDSLHYVGTQKTQYQIVLESIWNIIENYDNDKQIPTFGFGAKPRFPNLNSKETMHCFPINDNPQNPSIQGLSNVMSCYTNAVNHMQFSGPTYFVPILRQCFQAAQKIVNSYSYQIVLILTDGQIHDMAATKDLIVQNSNLPMSIIIVGIGNEDFANMKELDGDGGLCGSNGNKCPRDIVQFVPFNKFNGNSQQLTSQLLKQIPTQVVQYFRMIGRLPQPMKAPSMDQIAPTIDKNLTNQIFSHHM